MPVLAAREEIAVTRFITRKSRRMAASPRFNGAHSRSRRHIRTPPPHRHDCMSTKVLFISHDAQPHGAQILLLNLIRWIAANTSLKPHVLLKHDGPLRKDFEAVSPVSIWPQGDPSGFVQKC